MHNFRRYTVTLLLFLVAVTAFARRDSTLWRGIRDAGIAFRVGQVDSAFARSRRLLRIAESQNDNLAMATIHNLEAMCLSEDGNKRGAREEWTECVRIAEANNFLQRARKSKNSFYVETMLPTYAQLAISYKDIGNNEQSLRYARTGMEWLEICNNAKSRTAPLSSFAEILMDNKQYSLIYSPMKRGVYDAISYNQPDFALVMTAYLVKIEHNVMHRNPKDIPWIKVGNQLLSEAKTETAKTAFLEATKLDIGNEETSVAKNDSSYRKNVISTDSNKVSNKYVAKNDSVRTRIEYVKQRNERIGFVVGLLAVVLIAFAVYIVYQRQRRKKSRQQAEHEKTESYVEGQESERDRLAKELHDGVSNQLLAIEIKLREEGLTPQTMQLLTESREQVRRVSHELIPPEFEHTNLDEAISNYASELDGLHDCEVSYTSTPANADWPSIPKTTALEIYRITQEAVSNALKYSKATAIAIGMHWNDDDTLTIIISDNGTVPIDSGESGKGIGKRTVKERSSSINGKIESFRHAFGNVVRLTVKLS